MASAPRRMEEPVRRKPAENWPRGKTASVRFVANERSLRRRAIQFLGIASTKAKSAFGSVSRRWRAGSLSKSYAAVRSSGMLPRVEELRR